MPDELLGRLWARLSSPVDAPALEVVASLRELPAAAGNEQAGGGRAPDASAEVEMTWTPRGGRGTSVFLYRMRSRHPSRRNN
eukprot:119845-Prymnesium_polylepis.1